MSKIVVLDAGPLGMISNPNATGINRDCYEWMEALLVSGFDVRVPEIADYEVRREHCAPIRAKASPDLIF